MIISGIDNQLKEKNVVIIADGSVQEEFETYSDAFDYVAKIDARYTNWGYYIVAEKTSFIIAKNWMGTEQVFKKVDAFRIKSVSHTEIISGGNQKNLDGK